MKTGKSPIVPNFIVISVGEYAVIKCYLQITPHADKPNE